MLQPKYDATIDVNTSLNRIIVTVVAYEAIRELLSITIGRVVGINVEAYIEYAKKGEIYIWYNCNYAPLDVLNELHEVLNQQKFTNLLYKMDIAGGTLTASSPTKLFK
jgi:hypothetical protein